MALPERCSLVFFSLQEALCEEYPLGGPEPDYLKWLNGLLFAETGAAFEHVHYLRSGAEEREAWQIYGDAVSATHKLLELSRRNFLLFQRVARRFSVLPCLMSHHPAARGFNRSTTTYEVVTNMTKANTIHEQAEAESENSLPQHIRNLVAEVANLKKAGVEALTDTLAH